MSIRDESFVKDESVESKTEDIARDGDVVVVAGREKKRMRVHSLFLKNASKVFSAMFGPNFNEGHKLRCSFGGTTELDMPEDDPAALSVIFRIIHGRNESLKDTLTPRQIMQVTITADKYDCLVPLTFAAEYWFKPQEVTSFHNPHKMWEMMTAAYWINHDRGFKDLTLALMLGYSGSYLTLTKGCHDLEMALKICVLLEEGRSKMRAAVSGILLTPVQAKECQCGLAGKAFMQYLSSIKGGRFALFPQDLLSKTVLEAIKLAESIPDPVVKGTITCKE